MIYILGIAYGVVIPIAVLLFVLNFCSYSNLNLSLVYIGFLAHIDLVSYFLYKHIKGKNK